MAQPPRIKLHQGSWYVFYAEGGRSQRTSLRTKDKEIAERRFAGWEDWAVTTVVDTGENVATVWRAIDCHRSQLRDYQKLKNLPVEEQRNIFETQSFYRAFSLCNGGRVVEEDLFAGLR